MFLTYKNMIDVTPVLVIVTLPVVVSTSVPAPAIIDVTAVLVIVTLPVAVSTSVPAPALIWYDKYSS